MRAAHLQAIDNLELKNDPVIFKRYAEKVRTHLFDLSRIGEMTSVGLIEKICLRLQLHDRLAWNDGRKGGLETRSLNTFVVWLCERATAYQNAYSIAAEQTTPIQKSSVRFATRSNQVSSKHSSTSHTSSKSASRLFCFKCEGEHRLESCGAFKSSSVGERVSFCAKHRLCFGCLKPRHSIGFCPQRKPCSQSGCILFHHALLQDVNQANTNTSTIVHPATLFSDTGRNRRVAMEMMRLRIQGADGQWITANVLVDEGSDSTLMRKGFTSLLKLRGAYHILTVIGAGNVINHYPSQRISFGMRDSDGSIVTIICSTLPTVASDIPVTDWPVLKKRWNHLADLPVTMTGGKVDILIGTDLHPLVTASETGSDQRSGARWNHSHSCPNQYHHRIP